MRDKLRRKDASIRQRLRRRYPQIEIVLEPPTRPVPNVALSPQKRASKRGEFGANSTLLPHTPPVDRGQQIVNPLFHASLRGSGIPSPNLLSHPMFQRAPRSIGNGTQVHDTPNRGCPAFSLPLPRSQSNKPASADMLNSYITLRSVQSQLDIMEGKKWVLEALPRQHLQQIRGVVAANLDRVRCEIRSRTKNELKSHESNSQSPTDFPQTSLSVSTPMHRLPTDTPQCRHGRDPPVPHHATSPLAPDKMDPGGGGCSHTRPHGLSISISTSSGGVGEGSASETEFMDLPDKRKAVCEGV